jgi:hypothetical protein
VAGLAILPVALTSCGPSKKPGDTRLPVYPVQGEIYINEKPAAGVQINLDADPPLQQPAESRGGVSPRGTTDATGKYIIETYAAGDGAPAAKYNIRLRAPLKQGGFSKSDENTVDRLEDEYKDSKKNAQADPQFTFEVKEADPMAEPQKIPRISLKVEGWEESEPKKVEPGNIEVPAEK